LTVSDKSVGSLKFAAIRGQLTWFGKIEQPTQQRALGDGKYLKRSGSNTKSSHFPELGFVVSVERHEAEHSSKATH
jgi:hypothetical protein